MFEELLGEDVRAIERVLLPVEAGLRLGRQAEVGRRGTVLAELVAVDQVLSVLHQVDGRRLQHRRLQRRPRLISPHPTACREHPTCA